jgi:hypothetical protein
VGMYVQQVTDGEKAGTALGGEVGPSHMAHELHVARVSVGGTAESRA